MTRAEAQSVPTPCIYGAVGAVADWLGDFRILTISWVPWPFAPTHENCPLNFHSPRIANPTNVKSRPAASLRSAVCRWLLLGLVGAWAGGTAWAQEAPLRVFVLAGQSNMYGNGAVRTDLPADLLAPQKDVLVFQDGTWVPLEPGKAPLQAGQTFGPEVTFGRAMAQHFGGPIGIIKLSPGGTNLAVQWSPEAAKSLYGKLLRSVQDARKSRPIVIAGMLWMQGEADAVHEEMAGAYQKNLTHLIEAARRDFGSPGLPFACGSVNPPPTPRYAYADLVRKAQAGIDLPGYRMFDCDDLPKGNDHLHYNSRGQRELGERFARALVELLPPGQAPKQGSEPAH